MNNALGIALLIGGIILLIFGFRESESFGSEVSRVFTGNPTDRSIWMIGLGAVAAVAGLVLTLRGSRKS